MEKYSITALMQKKAPHNRFTSCWIRKNGPLLWSIRSHGLTSLDVCFWGYVKDIDRKSGIYVI